MRRRIVAAGAVLWRGDPDDPEIALVHRPRYDDWTLPKGKVDPGESIWAAAAREVLEETGCTPTLSRYLGRVSYSVSTPEPATKVVHFAVAKAVQGRFLANAEVDQLRWLRPDVAGELLSYTHDRAILTTFRSCPPNTATVLLVRHAKAGKRDEWAAADELRPLSGRGRKQAKALRGLLPLFGPNRVYSAPLVRCEQTVEGVADDLGVPVRTEPLLSEVGYQADPEAAVARFVEIAMAGGVPVVCSQGGVIPDLLARLIAGTGVTLSSPKSRKGSVWVLSFPPVGTVDPRLLAARYISDP